MYGRQAAEAIKEFIAIEEWRIAGINAALTSLDRGEGVDCFLGHR